MTTDNKYNDLHQTVHQLLKYNELKGWLLDVPAIFPSSINVFFHLPGVVMERSHLFSSLSISNKTQNVLNFVHGARAFLPAKLKQFHTTDISQSLTPEPGLCRLYHGSSGPVHQKQTPQESQLWSWHLRNCSFESEKSVFGRINLDSSVLSIIAKEWMMLTLRSSHRACSTGAVASP